MWRRAGPSLATAIAICGCGGGTKTVVEERTVTTPARPGIELQRGIAGLTVGMSQSQVRAALGGPEQTAERRDVFGPSTLFLYAGGLTVTFHQDAVTAVEATGRAERTPSGVGVGSTEAEVRSGVPGVSCQTVAARRSCQVGEGRPGEIVTFFRLDAGRVSRVTVGRVLD